MLQGCDVTNSRMNVRPAQGAGVDDAEAKLRAGLTLIREFPIAPAQHILFFVIYT